jgi:nucleoside-diphosphate-sugar epimerase
VTYVPDFARTLIELARHEEAFGQAWHVPSVPAVSIRRFSELVGEAARTGTPKLSRLSRPMLRLVGLFVPGARETVEMLYEFEEPFVLASSKCENAFGLTATRSSDQYPRR